MSQEEKDRKKKIKQLLIKLESGNKTKILEALKGFKVHGDSSVITNLLTVWNQHSERDGEISNEVLQFMCDLKHNDSATPIMKAVKSDLYPNIRLDLLTSIWNSKVDYSEFLTDFIERAVKGDFMETLECLTIIENMEGPFQEHQFLDAQITLSEYAEIQNKEPKKEQLMSEIARIVKEFETNHIEF